MNDDHSPSDDELVTDELVSAVLDGEATPAERALVEGSSKGGSASRSCGRWPDAMAAPMPPLDRSTADALVTRALAASTAVDGEPEPVGRGDEMAARRDLRESRHLWRRVAGTVAAVAAVVVVIAGVAALAQSGTRGSSDSASSGADTSGASSSEASPTANAEAAPLSGITPPDLGALDDAETALDRYAVLVALDPSIDHQFDARSPDGATATGADSGRRAVPCRRSRRLPESRGPWLRSASCPRARCW